MILIRKVEVQSSISLNLVSLASVLLLQHSEQVRGQRYFQYILLLYFQRKICGIKRYDAIIEWTALKWFAKFCSRGKSLKDAPYSGQPIEVDFSDIKALIKQDRSLHVREIAHMLEIDFGTIQRHLKDLGYVSCL